MLALRVWLCLALACSFLLLPVIVSAQKLSVPALVVPLIQVTHTASQSGSWSAPETWGNGIPPQGARVLIPKGLTVTVDREVYDEMFWIRVEGTLRFAQSVDTALVAETVVVMHGGKLEIGTATDPTTARAMLTFKPLVNEPIDLIYDPFKISRGLLSEGLIEMHGQPKTAWIPITALPAVGDSFLNASTLPEGWKFGDVLALSADTYGRIETFTLTQAPTASLISISPPVKYARSFPKDCAVFKTCSLHLANLTRNVVIRSDPASAGNPELQGHVMLMHQGGHRISYAQFSDLGRTTTGPVNDPLVGEDATRDPSLAPDCGLTVENVRGRYAVHFHMATPFSALSLIEGSVVTEKPGSNFKIGFINHSSNVHMRNNVSYEIAGSHFFTEEGDEVGLVESNLAMGGVGKQVGGIDHDLNINCMSKQYPQIYHRRRMNVGFQGYGYWVHGGGVKWINNVDANVTSLGLSVWSRVLSFLLNNTYNIQFPAKLHWSGGAWAGKEYLPVDDVPFWVEGHQTYGSNTNERYAAKAGYEIKFNGMQNAIDYPSAPMSVFKNNLGWNHMMGLITAYAGRAAIDGFQATQGTAFIPRTSDGIGMQLAVQGGNSWLVTNTTINSFQKSGINPSKTDTYVNTFVNGQPYPPPAP